MTTTKGKLLQKIFQKIYLSNITR